jgi:alpha-N-acetylglucosaminidase
LIDLDSVLSTNKHFRLSTWLAAARATVNISLSHNEELVNFLDYEARNQITLWGPTGQISDYASKSWGGLVSEYYLPRWNKFVGYLIITEPVDYNQTEFQVALLKWELQ